MEQAYETLLNTNDRKVRAGVEYETGKVVNKRARLGQLPDTASSYSEMSDHGNENVNARPSGLMRPAEKSHFGTDQHTDGEMIDNSEEDPYATVDDPVDCPEGQEETGDNCSANLLETQMQARSRNKQRMN